MPLNLATTGLKVDIKPDASAFGSHKEMGESISNLHHTPSTSPLKTPVCRQAGSTVATLASFSWLVPFVADEFEEGIDVVTDSVIAEVIDSEIHKLFKKAF